MKRFVLLALSAVLLSSCGPSRLYYWGSNPASDNGTSKYEQLAYKHYDTQTPEAICELLCVYEDMVSHPGGKRGVVPPGICAEYGFLLLQPETATNFAAYATAGQKRKFDSGDYSMSFREKGLKLLQMEMELYPESKAFIGPLLQTLSNR